MYVIRPEIGSIIAGGVDRLSFGFTKPYVEEFKDDFTAKLFGDPSKVRIGNRWASDGFLMPCRGIRKAKCSRLIDAAWSSLADTCFAGIPYEQWEPEFEREHPEAVPKLSWIGEVPLEISISPLEDADRLTLTLTGPYDEWNNRWREGDFPWDTPKVLAWLVPPRLEEVTGDPDECPFTGTAMRSYYHAPSMGSSPVIDLDELIVGMPAEVAAALRNAAAGSPPDDSQPEYPRLEWRTTIDLWLRPNAIPE